MKGVLPPTIGKSVSELGGHRNVNGHEFKEGISKNQNFEPGPKSKIRDSDKLRTRVSDHLSVYFLT